MNGEAFRYDRLAPVGAFESVGDPAVYTALPDDWVIGVTDVVNSTEAIAAGRYKAVNMAGAAGVSAVANAIRSLDFPFVFGGDGAVLAVPPQAEAATAEALAATMRLVEEELRLALRAGLIPVAAIRRAGREVAVARYAVSPHASYAMFTGGGVTWAEGELKAGRIGLAPAPPGSRPDLTGLSCRWAPITRRHGLILSVLVSPAEGAEPAAFRRTIEAVLALASREERSGHPVAEAGPRFAFLPSALRTEAALTRAPGQGFGARFAGIAREMVAAIALDRLKRRAGGFDPARYRRLTAQNSDFRKYEDGLRMTIDCAPTTAEAVSSLLAEAESQGIVDYGLHAQDAALMTCIVPAYSADDHLHFLDGAGGGYAMAAKSLKERRAGRRRDGGALTRDEAASSPPLPSGERAG